MFLTEPLLNNTHNESEANESEKVLQKRSDISDAANNHQNKCNFCLFYGYFYINRSVGN